MNESLKTDTQTKDPLLDHPDIPEDAKLYLHVWEECGDASIALKEIWKQHGIRVSWSKVNGWRRTIVAFAEAFDTLRRINAAEVAEKFEEAAQERMTGGQSTFYAQQLNRLAPDEYVPAIVTQQHMTVTYKVEAGFEKEPEKEK